MSKLRWSADLAIVGAGPAGLSAACVAAGHGLNVCVLDEFPRPGGRMLGQFHEEPGKGWWIGRQVAERLISRAEKLGVRLLCGHSVHGLERTDKGWKIESGGSTVTASRLLLATGAAELPNPLPGWTLPGVMSIGAAQVMTNVHFVKPGQRGVIIGVNVLGLAIARELAVSGVDLAAIVLPPAGPFSGDMARPEAVLKLLSGLAHLAPSTVLRTCGTLLRTTGWYGIAARLLPRSGVSAWGIPLRLRTAAVSIQGQDHVESVTLVDLDGSGTPIHETERQVPVDFVAIAGGLYPLAELASVAGCPFLYVPELGGHIPVHSEALRTPVPGLYVAGNITGVESAQVAIAQGELAATTICLDAGVLGEDGPKQQAAAMARVRQVRTSAIIQFHPDIQTARDTLYRERQA